MKILTIAASFLFLFWALASLFVIPVFANLFEDFGADLPFLTELVLSTYKYWIGLALLPLPLFYSLRQSKIWQARVLYCLLALAILLILLTVVALYLPTYELGKVVG